MIKIYAVLAAWFLALFTPSVWAQHCNPAPGDVAKLVEIRPKFHTVSGPLAAFDPCQSSVKLQKPLNKDKPGLMIIVHGGGGLDTAAKNAAHAFQEIGMATLVFDAYEHNGFRQGFRFWSAQASNEARQRMIYKVALGAYEWAIKQNDINTRQLYFYGVSNGATVLANLAAALSPEHVKGIFAEGMPGMGLGLPDELKVPLRLVYGKLDNYGGEKEDDWIWTRQARCITNTPSFIHPKGNAERCNALVNRENLTPQPIEWFKAQKAKGANIDIWFYDQAAHGIFLGPVQQNMLTYGTDMKRYAWVGADRSAREKLLKDIQQYFKHQSF